MDKQEYSSKIHHNDDQSKFQIVSQDGSNLQLDNPSIKIENRIKYFLIKYVRPHIDKDTYKYIATSGSKPGLLYGSAEVYKINCPLKPIVSTYDTPEYNLAKYLNSYITPVICSKSKHSVSRNSDL